MHGLYNDVMTSGKYHESFIIAIGGRGVNTNCLLVNYKMLFTVTRYNTNY